MDLEKKGRARELREAGDQILLLDRPWQPRGLRRGNAGGSGEGKRAQHGSRSGADPLLPSRSVPLHVPEK